MTLIELKRRTIQRLPAAVREQAGVFADEFLKPYEERDGAILDGKVVGEVWSEELQKMVPREKVLHRPRPVRPYQFGPESIAWLDRELRRRLGI